METPALLHLWVFRTSNHLTASLFLIVKPVLEEWLLARPQLKSAFLQQLEWEILEPNKWGALTLQTDWWVRITALALETAGLMKNSNLDLRTLTKLNEMKTLSKSILTLSKSFPELEATLNRVLEKNLLLKDVMLALPSLRETTRYSLWTDNCLKFLQIRNPLRRQKTLPSSIRGDLLATLKTMQMPLQDLSDVGHLLWGQTLQKYSLYCSRPLRTSRTNLTCQLMTS